MISIINTLFNLLFPPRCVACRAFSEQAICQNCQKDIEYLREHIAVGNLSVYCLAVYSGIIKKAICRLKFARRRNLLPLLQELILKNIPASYQGDELIIPVPLSAKRKRERGFNQAELLIEHLATMTGIEMLPNAVERIKITRPLFELHELERQAEIQGAFRIKQPELINGRQVIIFDDIVTTGSTINELASELRKAGATSVKAWCLARAVLRRKT